MPIQALAAPAHGRPLERWSYDPQPLPEDWVEVAVETCGVCHSDLSMLDNDWRRTRYPFVPGHEVVGRVVAAGPSARRVRVGDRVGVGWYASSCMACTECMDGRHHLCGTSTGLITDGYGGFADRVRCHWGWATPLPEGLDAASAGPLFCGGITVFGPIEAFGVKPTDRVGVVGIGGLGHLALRFLRAWGCEVTAFTSSESKRAEALSLGAHHTIASTDESALKQVAGQFDFILVTANVTLPWGSYLAALAPRGRLHFVGAVLEPVPVPAFALIGGQKSVSGSPLGSPATVERMLAFCARHGIAPTVERFPMSRANEALAHLRSGKARYRIVLENDLA
jgi:uncharacterized zinc-type alcohol dehydrogenase-like protein